MQIRYSYPIIPYDNSGDEYYFFIISIEGQSFLFRKYIYNSSSNSVSFNISYSYNTYMDIYKSIASFIKHLLLFLNIQLQSCAQKWLSNCPNCHTTPLKESGTS